MQESIAGTSHADCVKNDEREVCVGNVFESAFDITSRIFNFMSAKELLNAKLVCKSWQKAIDRLLSRRVNVVPFVSVSEWWYVRDTIPTIDAPSKFVAMIQKSDVVPGLVFALHYDEWHYQEEEHDDGLRSLRDCLPAKCGLVGAVRVDDDFVVSVAMKHELWCKRRPVRTLNGISGFVFPQALLNRQDVLIRPFDYSADTFPHLCAPWEIFKSWSRLKTLRSRFNWPYREDVKCAIVFTQGMFNDDMAVWLGGMGDEVALCGGHLGELDDDSSIFGETQPMSSTMREEAADRRILMGGMLLGGSAVKASSLVLSERVNSKTAVLNKLTGWKESVIDKWPWNAQKIAFVSICCGRSSNNKEPDIFREVFPNIPLCGIRADGEYGNNVPATINSNTKKRRIETIEHTYSCVFVIVSFDVQAT